MDKIEQIKNELREIKERNKRVELDKAWETSTFRKILVGVLTYAVIVLFSTLSIPFFKNFWLKKRKQA